MIKFLISREISIFLDAVSFRNVNMYIYKNFNLKCLFCAYHDSTYAYNFYDRIVFCTRIKHKFQKFTLYYYAREIKWGKLMVPFPSLSVEHK